MPPLLSNAKVAESLISRRYGVKDVIRSSKWNENLSKSAYIRPFRCVAAGKPFVLPTAAGFEKDFNFSLGRVRRSNVIQTRQFFGFGHGGQGSDLSKVYQERRVVGYSPEQLFNVVAAVDLYHGFVPWCQRSEIIKHHPDGTFDAELEIGFKFLAESYISHVELNKPKSIRTSASRSMLFDHLINIWEFNSGPVPGTCSLYFLVDFKFQSPLYSQVASISYKEVVSRLVNSFSERFRLIYGPGIAVLDNSYSQRP